MTSPAEQTPASPSLPLSTFLGGWARAQQARSGAVMPDADQEVIATPASPARAVSGSSPASPASPSSSSTPSTPSTPSSPSSPSATSADEAIDREHIFETADPRDFADDAGPQYEDEDFDETDDDAEVNLAELAASGGDPEYDPAIHDLPPLSESSASLPAVQPLRGEDSSTSAVADTASQSLSRARDEASGEAEAHSADALSNDTDSLSRQSPQASHWLSLTGQAEGAALAASGFEAAHNGEAVAEEQAAASQGTDAPTAATADQAAEVDLHATVAAVPLRSRGRHASDAPVDAFPGGLPAAGEHADTTAEPSTDIGVIPSAPSQEATQTADPLTVAGMAPQSALQAAQTEAAATKNAVTASIPAVQEPEVAQQTQPHVVEQNAPAVPAAAPDTQSLPPAAPVTPVAPSEEADPQPHGLTEAEQALPPLSDFPSRFGDRELTWMDFNERVLEQAEDPELHLLERAWFLSIFSNNLDEFYMVRVAGLMRRIKTGMTPKRASGLDAHEVYAEVTRRAKELTARQARVWNEDVRPALAEHNIELLGWSDLSEAQQDKLTRTFRHQIYPVLTPLAVDPSHPFPYISGLSLNLAILLRNPNSGKEHFARVKLPDSLPRLIPVPGREFSNADRAAGAAFIPIEVLVGQHLDHLFPGMEVLEHHLFRVTRNEDLEVEEDDAENLLTAMEKELERRRFGASVRMEVEDSISPFVRRYLVRALGLKDSDVFALPAPLDLSCLNQLHDLDIPDLKYPRFLPVTAAGLGERETSGPRDIFAAMRDHDVLLHHPYDSFSTSVQEFVRQAAADPKVLAIKQTLYRTSGDSPIVDALIEAAEAGKQVVAIVEIKARFDEENNISWARKLEKAGVHVVYGMVGLKTHCKLLLVVRQESDGLRRYCHVGTGNYHPKTARGYEDLGLLTTDRDVAQDLTTLFNFLSGYAPRARFRRLLVAPRTVRTGLIERIEREIQNKRAGRDAWIRIKVNSIIDEETIDALYRASRAGVQVDIVVRGICGIKAGIPGLSENIRVRSILGRYLEHSRIYAFCNDGETELFIGSADLMHRNLDRRVEALVRMTDPDMVDYLTWLVTHEASDEVASWWMEADGSWTRHAHGPDGERLEDIQTTLMKHASKRVKGRR